MPGDSKAVARTVVVIVLLLLAVVALRGHLPGAEPPPDVPDPEPRGPGSVIPTLFLLSLSIGIIAIGLFNRRRRPGLPRGGELPYDQRAGRFRARWRLLLIASVALVAWLLVVLVLMRWGAGFTFDAVPADTESVATPEDGEAETALGDDLAELARPEPAGGSGNVFGYLAAVTIVLIVLSVVSAVIGRRRTAAAAADPAGGAAPSGDQSVGPNLARAAELGLAEIGDHTRDPREAIIACYVAMERELEKSPGTTPQDSDTPTEVLARAVERRALRADSAAELVDLFQEARFSAHVMNEGHRANAVRALRMVQRELQGAASGLRGTT